MQYRLLYETHILIVDDHSPDGTAALVKRYQKMKKKVHIIEGPKEGLGIAYKRGFHYALNALDADIVIQMDADGSHDPGHIPSLLEALKRGYDVAIGSRYISGGTIPKDWPLVRRLNSLVANIVARWVARLRPMKDCTSGFKAIRATVLDKLFISFIPVKGFSFQIRLLDELIRAGAHIVEIPIDFQERGSGKSKLSFHDISEFLFHSFRIRFKKIYLGLRPQLKYIIAGLVLFIISLNIYLIGFDVLTLGELFVTWFVFLSIAIVLQSLFTLAGMVFAWDDPKRVEYNRSPKTFYKPTYSFTALVPALYEEAVIGDTIKAITNIQYPEQLKELIIICRFDDSKTIQAVRQKIHELGKDNIRLLIPSYMPKNKPDKLNFALEHAKHDVVCIFDAEDTPHEDIYHVINTVMIRDDADVVQSGVQLINFRSHWFSTLNVLEYFFWFKSILHYFSLRNVIPLGGNTVFFKRKWLNKISGWDADCLTEDADIGITLSAQGAKIRIIYDEIHATQEETPESAVSFIKQRTRWNQGFIQIFKKGYWKKLPLFSQRFFVGYLLIWPEIQTFLFLYIIASVIMMFTVKLPILITLLSLLPLYILTMHLIVLNVGLYEFTKKYSFKYPRWIPIKVIVTFLPFQILLGISAIRAVIREFRKKTSWEKTVHVNAHRSVQHTNPTSAET